VTRSPRPRSAFPVIVLLAFTPLAGCLSTAAHQPQDFAEAPLYGMVYDYDNLSCAEAIVIVDEKEEARSDINGRFVVTTLPRGHHQVIVRKDGYEDCRIGFEFLNRTQVLYVRIISASQLMRQVEGALEQKDLARARQLLDRTLAVAPKNPVARYLLAVYLLQDKHPDEAVALLLGILDEGYRDPTLYLTLADLYQYSIDDPKQARTYLEKYLQLRQDPGIQRRLEALP
jgi:tetratricopeptide (TPR) repeat protein